MHAATLMNPYFAVIFTSILKQPATGYAEMAAKMEQLAKQQPGYLGIESARDTASGITISYWASEQAIKDWKNQLEHQLAQKLGREKWYQHYHVRVAKVEREYEFNHMDDVL